MPHQDQIEPGQYVSDCWMPAIAELRQKAHGVQLAEEDEELQENTGRFLEAFVAVYVALQAYVVNHHKKGLSWNPGGCALAGPPLHTPNFDLP
eukprot:3465667-Prymnesium_polylepis.1